MFLPGAQGNNNLDHPNPVLEFEIFLGPPNNRRTGSSPSRAADSLLFHPYWSLINGRSRAPTFGGPWTLTAVPSGWPDY